MGPGGEMRPTFLLCYVGSAVEFCGHGRVAKGSPKSKSGSRWLGIGVHVLCGES